VEHNPEACQQRFKNIEDKQDKDESRLQELDKVVNDTKENLAVNVNTTQMLAESYHKVADAIDSISETLAGVNKNLIKLDSEQDMAKSIHLDFKNGQEKLRDEVEKNKIDLKVKIEEIENKGKIDTIIWIKDNFFKLGFIAGLIYFVVEKIFT